MATITPVLPTTKEARDMMLNEWQSGSYGEFVHLHCHSDYSLRDAAVPVKKFVKRLQELRMDAAALTEHGNMFSVMDFVNACKKESIKPIVGCEVYVLPHKEWAELDDKELKHIKYHMTILCKDYQGYQQLVRAITNAQLLKDKKQYPRMTYADMKKYFIGGHVVVLSGCMSGEIALLLLAGKYEEAKEKALFYQQLFGKGNFFIELQDHVTIPDEQIILQKSIELAEELGIPMVATNDTHYATKNDVHLREMIVALRFGQKVNSPSFDDFRDCGHLYVKDTAEMTDLFSAVPDALVNTRVIAEMCNVEFPKEKRYPHYKALGGKTEEEKLWEKVQKGLKLRFPDFKQLPSQTQQEIKDRIAHEMDVIIKANYPGYLLIVEDFIREGKKDGLVGLGRGSAVGSLVCYLIGITNVNPLKYDLLFERFLNLERVSAPDIDIDFCDKREKVIDYVKGVYGKKAVCNIITFGTMAARAAIRNAGRVTGVHLSLCDRVAKMVPAKPGMTLENAMLENLDLKNEYDNDQQVRQLIDDAVLMEGLIVQTGVHAAGVIIADRPLVEYIPLVYDEKEDIWISQCDYKTAESEYGLLKMDFLGLETLTIIKRTFQAVKERFGRELTLDTIPMDDKEVIREIFAKGRTKGVFQFESSGMVDLLKRFKPTSLEDLILLNAAYRPGPLQYLDEIIDVKHKRKIPTYICPQAKDLLEITYGKPIYQEQIMQIFNEIAGFSLGEADIIRRAMGKKLHDELNKYMPKFKDGLQNAGATKEDAEQFCEEMMDFARYAFNKSHSAAYSETAYITAYLKHYYPAEFMAAVLTSANNKKLPIYIKECRDMGIEVLPPSINESGEYFTATQKGTIRFGLAGIKNVGKACQGILATRHNDLFESVEEFIERMLLSDARAVNKRVVESLIYAGALDDLGYNRQQMIEGCMSYIKDLKNYYKKLANPPKRPQTLANAKAKAEAPHFDISIMEMGRHQLLEKEKEIIKFYASGHPLEDYQSVIDEKADMSIGDIDVEKNGHFVTVVGQISEFIPLNRKSDGASMGKFTLADTTADIDCIVFTKPFAQYGDNIKEGAVVIVKGFIEAEEETVVQDATDGGEPMQGEINLQLQAKQVLPITADQKVYLRLNNPFEWEPLKQVVANHNGICPLYVYFEDEAQMFKAKSRVRVSKQFREELENTIERSQYAILT